LDVSARGRHLFSLLVFMESDVRDEEGPVRSARFRTELWELGEAIRVFWRIARRINHGINHGSATRWLDIERLFGRIVSTVAETRDY